MDIPYLYKNANMEDVVKQKEFDGTISLKPYKFCAELNINGIIYVSIFKEDDEKFNNKDEPLVRLSIDQKKKPRWDELRNIGGVYIAVAEYDKIVNEAIKQLETVN